MSCKKQPYKPYAYWELEELQNHLIRMCFLNKRKAWLLGLVKEAIDSKDWNPIEDFDGCSVVQDDFHPSPACFVHDYMWKVGMGGKESDLIFYYAMLLSGMDKNRAFRRWIGVRVGWIFYYKWYHLRKRNVNKLSANMLAALKDINK